MWNFNTYQHPVAKPARNFGGGQIFQRSASNTIRFGTPPFQSQNDKIWQEFWGGRNGCSNGLFSKV